MPKVYLASDHAGFALKAALLPYIGTLKFEAVDMGPASLDPKDDYPDCIAPLARQVATEPGSFGIIIGGSGQGEAMCANRVAGVRAGVFYGEASESQTSGRGRALVALMRMHNDANILSIGARFVTPDEAERAVKLFLETPFSNAPEHVRRLAKF